MAVPGRAATVPTAAKRPLSRQEGNVARARLVQNRFTPCASPQSCLSVSLVSKRAKQRESRENPLSNRT